MIIRIITADMYWILILYTTYCVLTVLLLDMGIPGGKTSTGQVQGCCQSLHQSLTPKPPTFLPSCSSSGYQVRSRNELLRWSIHTSGSSLALFPRFLLLKLRGSQGETLLFGGGGWAIGQRATSSGVGRDSSMGITLSLTNTLPTGQVLKLSHLILKTVL